MRRAGRLTRSTPPENPAEVASLALWLAGPDAAMVTGASYTMDGGWSAH